MAASQRFARALSHEELVHRFLRNSAASCSAHGLGEEDWGILQSTHPRVHSGIGRRARHWLQNDPAFFETVSVAYYLGKAGILDDVIVRMV